MFDWSWDSFNPTKDLLQNMVYEESLFYHPEIKEGKEGKEVGGQMVKGKKDGKEGKEGNAVGGKYRFYQ
jgi:hypothetical protein